MITVKKDIRGFNRQWLQTKDQQKKTLLFLHGFPDSPWIWQKQFDFFKDQYFILAPFSPGIETFKPFKDKKRSHLDSMLLDMFSIFSTLELDLNKYPIDIIATDIGSALAWELARSLGQKVNSLSIINGVSIDQLSRRFATNKEQLLKSWYMAVFKFPFLAEKFIKFDNGSRWHKTLENKGHPFPFESKINILPMLEQYRSGINLALTTFAQQIAKISCPLNYICAKNDPFLLPSNNYELEKMAENFQIKIVDGGHWVYYEESELINEEIFEFLRKIN